MNSPRIKPSKVLILSIFLLFFSVACSNPQILICARVVDGDNIVLSNNERVRLIGVDTPETKHPQKPVEYFGKEATAFTNKMVGEKVFKLRYDQQRRDKYGRLLANVYLPNGTFLNAEIIKQGYGYAYTRFPFKYMESLSPVLVTRA